jgi:hypothetical protein
LFPFTRFSDRTGVDSLGEGIVAWADSVLEERMGLIECFGAEDCSGLVRMAGPQLRLKEE